MLNVRHWWHRSRLPWPLPLTFTESPDPVLDIDPPDSARFPTIKAIAIYYKAWTHSTLVERLLQDDGWAARALRVIDLAFSYGSAWTLLWVPVIHAAAAQLRSITIPMPGRALPTPDEPRWAFALAEQHRTSRHLAASGHTHGGNTSELPRVRARKRCALLRLEVPAPEARA